MKVLSLGFLLMIASQLKAGSVQDLKRARVISFDQQELKIVSGKEIYLVDRTRVDIPEDLCNEDIRVPRGSFKKVLKASKRQLSLMCRPQKREDKKER
jgi:hypothetical protein